MAKNNDTQEKSYTDELLKKIWGNPLGKIVVVTTSVLGCIALAGFSLKLATFAVNNFKDFRAAYKR
jgi:hypothetical protein